MQRDEPRSAEAARAVETVEASAEAEPRPAISLEDLVLAQPTHVEPEAPREVAPPAHVALPSLRTARVVSVSGRRAKVASRSGGPEIDALIAAEVDRELIEETAAERGTVLVEIDESGVALITGVVQTKKPGEVRVTGQKVVVEAEREVLLRAGRAALRLREDGDVELVGSRISAASRGLFRIVGRILRLN